MKKNISFILLFSSIGFFLCGCVESSFDLAESSRIPKWFTDQQDLDRAEFRVTLDYYTSGAAVFKLYTKDSFLSLDRVESDNKGQIVSANDSVEASNQGYPRYLIITIDGISEVIEHRQMEPIFHIVDDQEILTRLLK